MKIKELGNGSQEYKQSILKTIKSINSEHMRGRGGQ